MPRVDEHAANVIDVLIDGRAAAVIPVLEEDDAGTFEQSNRALFRRAIASLPTGTLEHGRTLELKIRSSGWRIVIPIRGCAAQVLADGCRLIRFKAEVDVRAFDGRIDDHHRTRGMLHLTRTSRRTGCRARGAGRPAGTRRSTASSSPDDDPGPGPRRGPGARSSYGGAS